MEFCFDASTAIGFTRIRTFCVNEDNERCHEHRRGANH